MVCENKNPEKCMFHRFNVLQQWFKEYMGINGYRPRSIKNYDFEIGFFRRWIEKTYDEIEDIDDVTSQVLQDYATNLYDRKLTSKTRNSKLSALSTFFKAIYREKKFYENLAAYIVLPKVGRTIPANIPSEAEIAKVLDFLEASTRDRGVEEIEDALAYRDRAILEIFYSCALRKGELIGLSVGDIRASDNLVYVNGKGGRERMVPIGDVSLSAVEQYIERARSFLLGKKIDERLFLNRFGTPMSEQAIKDVVDKVIAKAGIDKHVKVHGLRHCCATHMHDHGADIRHLQEMLGHKCLSSTMIYTHVSAGKIKDVHRRCHPREQDSFGSKPVSKRARKTRKRKRGK